MKLLLRKTIREVNQVNKKVFIVLLVLFTVTLSVSSVSAGLFDFLTENQDLNVTDIEIVNKGYSLYDVNCEITPKKDFSYLEMTVIFYDEDDAVIEKNPLVWNINNPSKDQLMKVSGNAYITNSNAKPVRAEVFITDSPFNGDIEDAIFAENVTMS